jgi:hypothetical protein
MTLHFKQNNSVKISIFSSAADFFRWTGQKVLPGIGNTETFATMQAQHPKFCHGVDLMSYFKQC